MHHAEVRVSEFRSLSAALEGQYEKTRAELSDELGPWVDRAFVLTSWDALSPRLRRARAAEWDSQYDPALEQEHQREWEMIVRRGDQERKVADLKRQIAHAKAMVAPLPRDELDKQTLLGVLHQRLADEEETLRKFIREAEVSRGATVQVLGSISNMGAPDAASSMERATDEEMYKWMLQHQRDLKGDKKRHGREIILSAAQERFGVAYKVVREIWDNLQQEDSVSAHANS